MGESTHDNPSRHQARATIWAALIGSAGVIIAAWIGVDVGRGRGEEQVEIRKASAQDVDWVPNHSTRGAGICIDKCAEFVSWNVLKDELQGRVLPQVSQIPPGSSLRLLDSNGRRSWIIQVNAPGGAETAHLWIGNNPTSSWSYDGLVHVGSPKAPVRVWGSFQRYSDGTYRRK